MTQPPTASPRPRPRPLLSRRLDTLYVVYFSIHLAASVLIDAQLSLVPYTPRLYPAPVRAALSFYLEAFKDPFLLALARQDAAYTWFHALVVSEVVVQLPLFVVGIVALRRDDVRVYPLLVAYGTLAASSTMQCIASLVFGNDGIGLTPKEVLGLLQNYVPFCILPAVLCVDMSMRIIRLLPSPPSPASQHKKDR
ncbi:uncharacterized protein PFL1_06131 [Pseudozyma flocculosa PF-1]|uniref:EXPERA domain-containing protein n=2 Tax=Pseudozyma flocculosa TaxID=84751 RepID=A0A5C3F6R5_9BASI|nr:uncharacterized protein PFL1_06131 [Pseudozyma flocculosa PF-1]EPQ26195.1 hypothetical protein PFL1_06131 [Pseudozyma flocculosa PF-1]SPO40148.1 uncharacterized protein PSFLO_05630 [Pseudozyma flocculosa]